MAWPGYFVFAGVEIVNASRTEAYAEHAGQGWFRSAYRNDDLAPILGDDYDSPLQDGAPWTDPDDLYTYDFYGCYPLDVTGIEDSTSTAAVTESTIDGGVVSKPRHATRTVVWSLALVGGSDCAVEAGLRWLKAVLSGRSCVGQLDPGCQGRDLTYLSCEPSLNWYGPGDPTDCLTPYLRSLRHVTVISGPSVTAKMDMVNGGAVWTVQFTAVAGNPFEFSAEIPLIEGFMAPGVDVPYVGGVIPEGGSYDTDGDVIQDTPCPVPTFQPIFDPECPLVTPPPPVPGITMTCFDMSKNFRRRTFVIPPQYVPLWGEIVPKFTIQAPANTKMENLRLRFYADPDGNGNTTDNPCDFFGDIVFSYIPPNSTLVFDGSEQVIYVNMPNGLRQRADHLVYGSDGTPFEWPELSCGYGYIVTIDMPQTQSIPRSINMSLYVKVA